MWGKRFINDPNWGLSYKHLFKLAFSLLINRDIYTSLMALKDIGKIENVT